MHIHLEQIDSNVFGDAVLSLKDVECISNFGDFEKTYVKQYDPVYVYAKVNIEELREIHFLETQGFNFIEYQLRLVKLLPSQLYDLSSYKWKLDLLELTCGDDITDVLELADEIFEIDRIYIDPALGKSLANKRYREYIKKSQMSADEKLFKFTDSVTGELIGLHTSLWRERGLVLNFLTGIAKKYHSTGMAFPYEYTLFNYFIENGIKKVVTHISGANYQNLNFEFRKIGFKFEQGFAVLRRIYK